MRCECSLMARVRRLRFICVCLGLGFVGWSLLANQAVRAADDQPAMSGQATVRSEAPQAAAEEQPNPLQFKADLAIWTFAVFVVLFFFLKRFAWGPISESLDRRERHIAENIEAARRRDEEARQLLAEYERKLAGAADQVRSMLDEARQDAERTKQEIVAEARAAAQGEQQRAMRDIRTATDAAVEELSQRSADLAVQLAGKIISTKLTPEERSRLVKDSLSKFASASPSKN
jgi:F-type H+-transporting ATPase subunit b